MFRLNNREANAVWYDISNTREAPVKPDVPSVLSMQLTELKNSAAEFFTAAKCSISNAVNKFGDWVKRVFICTDFRSSDAGKPADSLLPEETMIQQQQLENLRALTQQPLIDMYNKNLINQTDTVSEKIEDKTQISQSELIDISTNSKLGLRNITTALQGIMQFKGLDQLSGNAKAIYETELKFDGLAKGVQFSQLGSVNTSSPVMGAVNNKVFTEQFKSQMADIFSRIREDIVPLLALQASGSAGNIC